jgi:4-amino-4-deoxy-L-arabinose transferase-like glycosyltransferase
MPELKGEPLAAGVARSRGDSTARRARGLLLGILCLALLIRLLHFWMIAGTPLPKHHLMAVEADDYAFFQWAQRIVGGDWLGRDTYHPYFEWMKRVAPLETWYRWWGGKEIFHQAPLYPYLLAGLLQLFRSSVPLALLAQLAIGALQPLVMYRLAALLFDPWVGLAAAALTALYGPFIFYEGLLLRDWLSPMLEPLALLAMLHARKSGRGWQWGVAGGVLGLALLAKETVLLLIPLVLLWLIWDSGRAWRQAVRAGTWVLIGLLIALSPLFLRNAMVGAPVFALSNRAAEAFAMGNIAALDRAVFSRILERSEGGLLPAGMETLRTYHGDASRFFGRQLRKLRGMIDPFEIPNNVSFSYGSELSPVLRWSLGYAFVFPLGLAGLILSLKRWRDHSLVFLYGLVVVAGFVLTSTISRYRLLLVPVLILYGAALLSRLVVALRERKARQALGPVVLVLGCVLFQQVVQRLPVDRPGVYPLDYLAAAQAYAGEEHFERAVAELVSLRAKIQPYPQFAKVVEETSLREGDYRAQWARQLLAEEKQEEARQQVALAETVYAQHPNLSYPNYNLGLLYLRLGEATKARGFLERFLALEPSGTRAERVRALLATLKTAKGG